MLKNTDNNGTSRRGFMRGLGLGASALAVAKVMPAIASDSPPTSSPGAVFPVQGRVKPGFEPVRDVIAANIASGADIGSSAAIFIDGEPVLDIWGGSFNETGSVPWRRDTIVNTFSTTKTMAALVMLMLADRGEIDLSAPVSKYWPEFATNGKSDVLVRHILGHTSGLPGWTEPMGISDILDHEKASTFLAQQAPWWEPGTAVGYHPISFGPLLSEIVRRVTGEMLGAFFAREVANPLGAEFHIGTGPECDARVSLMVESSPPRKPMGDGSITDRAFFNPYVLPQDSHSIAWRRGELAGSNGHGNAHGVALVQSVIANRGEVGGKRLLSSKGAERANELQFEGKDLVAGYPLRWGLGYALENPELNATYGNRFAGHRIAFWGGSGGSVVVNDLDLRMTIAFVMNKHVEHGGLDSRGVDYIIAAYDAVAKL